MNEIDVRTQIEIDLGVGYVDPKYPPGEHLRYGMIWDDRVLAIAQQVRAEMVKRGEASAEQDHPQQGQEPEEG